MPLHSLTEILSCDTQVDLRSLNVLVAEELLDVEERGPTAQQASSIGVSERMESVVVVKATVRHMSGQDVVDRVETHTPLVPRHKQGRLVCQRDDLHSAQQVGLKQIGQGSGDGDYAVLPSLSSADDNLTPTKIDIVAIHTLNLGPPSPGKGSRVEQHPIPQLPEGALVVELGPGCQQLGQVTLGDRPRHSLGGLRVTDTLSRVLCQIALLNGETKEGTQMSHHLVNSGRAKVAAALLVSQAGAQVASADLVNVSIAQALDEPTRVPTVVGQRVPGIATLDLASKQELSTQLGQFHRIPPVFGRRGEATYQW